MTEYTTFQSALAAIQAGHGRKLRSYRTAQGRRYGVGL